MKVLMYGWEFPPRISGGLGVACYAIVKELARKHVDLTLILPQTSPTDHIDNVNFVSCESLNIPIDNEFSSIVNIKYPAITTYLYPYVKAGNFKHVLSNEILQEFLLLLVKMDLPAELKAMVGDMVRTGSEIKITDRYEISLLTEVFRYALFAGALAEGVEHDVIHAHDWLTILAAIEARRYSHKPLVLHIHALETDRSGLWVDKKIYAIEKYGMEQADQIVAVSQYTKNNITEHYGIPSEKITVVHNGIYWDETIAPKVKKNDPQMVLFLGRITQQKGPYFFIEIAKKVLERKPEIQFVLAGTGDLFIDMVEHAAGLRLGKNIHFTGFLNSNQVQAIFQLADVYVMPSVSEPFGLSALEALANNVPAVISKQSGVSEVLHHTLVADFWDTEEMAAKVLALLEYQALGATSLAHTCNDLRMIIWDNTAEKIINLYQKAIVR
ncbi:MAG: glycosyltransferase [Coxiellaceae bacterium]|nr:glycosyltransferase [Coxiellaceae bacterium]